MDFIKESATDVVEKKKEYMNYINEHINNVRKAYQKLFIDNSAYVINTWDDPDEMKRAIEDAYQFIKVHDFSKFSEEEFEPYRMKYYPTDDDKAIDPEVIVKNYQEAWKHHYKENDHHPLFWCDEQGHPKDDMSLVAILHMLCDWEAMGMKFNTGTYDWYYNSAKEERDQMTENTKKIVEKLLEILFRHDSENGDQNNHIL